MVRFRSSLAPFAILPIVLTAVPALAGAPKTSGGSYEIRPQYQRASSWAHASLSGTLLGRAAATTSWFLYPGACVERALGTWSARTNPVADSLQPTAGFPNSSGYTDNQPDIAGGNNTIAYTRADQSLAERLFHIFDLSVPASQRPAVINESRSIWCGKFNPAWVRLGYPDVTMQILYIDTGDHGGSYTLTFQANVGTELNYDYFTIIGGGGLGQPDHLDPLENRRDFISELLPPFGTAVGGPHGDSDQIVSFTGSITTAQSVPMNGGGSLQIVGGAASGQPTTVSYSITVDGDHRALYLVVSSDDHFSSQDGLWPSGTGVVLDLIDVSDNGAVMIYNDETTAGGEDPSGGQILKGAYGTTGCISARAAGASGELWQLAPGTENVTADPCAPQRAFASDLFFEGGDPNTNLLINKQFNSIVSCTFHIPLGTASVLALWNEYLDLPGGSGYVQFAEYRYHKDGFWSDWRGSSPANERHSGGAAAWLQEGDELAEAAQADSVQLRWNIQCVPSYGLDKNNCSGSVPNGLLYDDLRLQVTTGVPAPIFGIFVGSVAQTTFVDGTLLGSNCAVAPCWPGVRGTNLGPGVGIDDNFNTPGGDSLTINCVTALRGRGMGINWKDGFDKSVNGGLTLAHTNASYNPAFDTPRIIYRLFDPTNKSWSPFDSSRMDADAVSVSGPDTSVIWSSYRVDWPPRDKAGLNLPGGFTINGIAAYNSLAFLPRGTRVQYYFKTVDINGGAAYQFSSDAPAWEVEDLPTLPGSSIRAPDIIEFRVLPGVYSPGSAGSLLAGRTTTPILNLDGSYTSWSFQQDPVTQALRGLGVRADRFRLLQEYEAGANVGGHELSGQRIARLSNYFPNAAEYPIIDSLATWYRILIQSSHTALFPVVDEQDARVTRDWWNVATPGANGGDRCIFASGDGFFDRLFAPGVTTERALLAQNVFGVNAAVNAWAGTTTTPYPTIDDRFAAASAGPGLAAPSTFTYPLDGGCPGPNRFDALVKIGSADAQNAIFYPNSEVAGVARMSEIDFVPDKDRNKALGYGYSIQFIRQTGYPPTQASYNHSGVENRMRVLYKFLTSCRGARTAAPADTGKCWPCPSPGTTLGLMQANWATQSSGFQTGTYGPLYAIQDHLAVTAVEDPAPATPPHVNALLQNRPNPFNPETTIPYSLAFPGRVTIRVFDVAGRLVKTLVDRVETAGVHRVGWNGTTDGGGRAASGVYFYRITYPDGEVSAKKLMILR